MVAVGCEGSELWRVKALAGWAAGGPAAAKVKCGLGATGGRTCGSDAACSMERQSSGEGHRFYYSYTTIIALLYLFMIVIYNIISLNCMQN